MVDYLADIFSNSFNCTREVIDWKYTGGRRFLITSEGYSTPMIEEVEYRYHNTLMDQPQDDVVSMYIKIWIVVLFVSLGLPIIWTAKIGLLIFEAWWIVTMCKRHLKRTPASKLSEIWMNDNYCFTKNLNQVNEAIEQAKAALDEELESQKEKYRIHRENLANELYGDGQDDQNNNAKDNSKSE